MKSLALFVMSLVMFSSHVFAAPNYTPAQGYREVAIRPFANITKTLVSIPAGMVGGIAGDITADKAKGRFFPGLAHGIGDTFEGAISTILLPITMPVLLGRVIMKKNITRVSTQSIFSSYFKGRNSFQAKLKRVVKKKRAHA